MTKKQLKILAKDSFQQGQMIEEVVSIVAGKLSRKELKEYLRLLRKEEQEQKVTVKSAFTPTDDEKNDFAEMYPEKNIEYITDTSLLVGTTIIQNDIITQYNLSDTLERLKEHASSTDK